MVAVGDFIDVCNILGKSLVNLYKVVNANYIYTEFMETMRIEKKTTLGYIIGV